MRPKITDKEWDKIVQDAFSAGAPEPHFSEEYCAKRRKIERKLAMKEERKNVFQPGLVLATVGALLIAAIPASVIVLMNRPASQPGIGPGTAVLETIEETVTETEEAAENGVTVPDLAGYRYEYATKVLEQKGFMISVVDELSEDHEWGSVIRLEPAPDTVLPEGSNVTLYVSKGEDDREVFELPDVKGLQQERAEALFEYYGINVEIIYESSEKPVGTVIAQSYTPGEALPSGSTVQLKVSAPSDKVVLSEEVETQAVRAPFEMPDLKAMKEEQAKTLLMYFGADVEIVYEPSEECAGTVIAQSIAPGEEIPSGSSVKLTIAAEN